MLSVMLARFARVMGGVLVVLCGSVVVLHDLVLGHEALHAGERWDGPPPGGL
jgi:hypothetical protein